MNVKDLGLLLQSIKLIL